MKISLNLECAENRNTAWKHCFVIFFILFWKFNHKSKSESKNHDLLLDCAVKTIIFFSSSFTLTKSSNQTSCKMFKFSWNRSNGFTLLFQLGTYFCVFFLVFPNLKYVVYTICFRWLHYDALPAHVRPHEPEL